MRYFLIFIGLAMGVLCHAQSETIGDLTGATTITESDKFVIEQSDSTRHASYYYVKKDLSDSIKTNVTNIATNVTNIATNVTDIDTDSARIDITETMLQDSAVMFYADTAAMLTTYILDAEVAEGYQPLEATLTDIADGTITENLINTTNPWADNEVVNTITASNYLLLTDTAAMLTTYLSELDTAAMLTTYLSELDTATMIDP